jgi:hypothetical protein
MSTPLTAIFRIVLTYPVASLSHKVRIFCNSPDTAQPYHVIQRDTTQITFPAAAQGLWDAVRRAYPSSVLGSSVQAEFQTLNGVSWNTVETTTVASNGLATGAGTIYGEQTTINLKDTLFRPVRVLLMETNDPFNNRVTFPTNVNAGQGTALEFTSGFTVTNPPFKWAMGRGTAYLAASGTLTSVVFSSNRKVRRARGIA